MGYILKLREELGHRPLIMAGACVLFVNEKKEILLQRRADNHLWGYPGGSMELGESFEETALICDELEFFTDESGKETNYIYPNGDEIYVAGIVYICRKFHGELKIQEDEVLEQKFFSEADLPEDLDPLNERIIRRAFSELA